MYPINFIFNSEYTFRNLQITRKNKKYIHVVSFGKISCVLQHVVFVLGHVCIIPHVVFVDMGLSDWFILD
jgi:putative flippase GtrA